MNITKLGELLDDIEKSGIADPLIQKLSGEFNIGNDETKQLLRLAINMINLGLR